MFKRKQIDQRVQKALFRKIDAMNRLGLTNDRVVGDDNKNKSFFIGDSLEPQDNSNPIEQHLYRGCFAKVSVAVKDQEKSTESNEVGQPISISSYIGKENDILSQKNKPLAFRQGFGESPDNRFLGESGITSINVNQMEYYTNNFNIGWVCPDPVFFEETFEPSFLKLGAYVAIEFGWGIDDREFQVESLSIEEMKRLLKGTNLIERNLNTAGNYYCGVGTVTKFDWKITDNGTYAGDIQVMSPGASALLETTQGTGAYSDVVSKIKSTFELQKTTERLKESKADNPELKKEQQEIIKKSNSATEVVESLKDNSILFNMVIKNLKDVMDAKLEGIEYQKDTQVNSPYGKSFTNIKGDLESVKNTNYKYKDGLLNVQCKQETLEEILAASIGIDHVPEYFRNRYFCNWAWFEDNILQDFFNLSTKDGVELQKVDSKLNGEPNKCQSSEYLYSLGLDHVILPNQHQPLLDAGFKAIKDKSLIEQYYSPKQRLDLMRMHSIYNTIDSTFGKEAPFRGGVSETDLTLEQETINIGGVEIPVAGDISSDGTFTGPFYSGTLENYGTIRNMVFPMEMYITHFQGISSLRQGLRNFWADVTNQYGGYWGFQIGESKEEPNTVGVFDSYYAPEGLNTIKPSDKLNTNETFEFSILSDKSIVKDFDVNLDLSAEASVLARYGGLNSVKDGNQSQDGKKDLGLEAWNILTANTTLEENLTKEDLEKYNAIDNAITSVRYKRENDSFYSSIESIQDDEDAYREQVENETENIVEGVGCYTKRGNFSKYFKNIMLYLINYSTAKGSGSNLEQAQIQIPVSLTMTLDGIGGLQVGNIFTIDYLPKLYRDNVYFMITKVNHKVSTTGWETDLEAIMTVRMKEVWKTSGKQLEAGLEDYLELFKITNVNNYNGEFDSIILTNKEDIERDKLAAEAERKRLLELQFKDTRTGTSTSGMAGYIGDILTGNAASRAAGGEDIAQTQAQTQFGYFKSGDTPAD
jgi:hypothetical protein